MNDLNTLSQYAPELLFAGLIVVVMFKLLHDHRAFVSSLIKEFLGREDSNKEIIISLLKSSPKSKQPSTDELLDILSHLLDLTGKGELPTTSTKKKKKNG